MTTIVSGRPNVYVQVDDHSVVIRPNTTVIAVQPQATVVIQPQAAQPVFVSQVPGVGPPGPAGLQGQSGLTGPLGPTGPTGLAVYSSTQPTPTRAGEGWLNPADGGLYVAYPNVDSVLVWVQAAVFGIGGATVIKAVSATAPDTSTWLINDLWYDTSTEILTGSGTFRRLASKTPDVWSPPLHVGFDLLSLSPVLWVDASQLIATDSTRTYIPDLSGNHRDLNETGTNLPLFVSGAINSLPAYRFDGAQEPVTSSPVDLSAGYSIVAVSNMDGGYTYAGFVSLGLYAADIYYAYDAYLTIRSTASDYGTYVLPGSGYVNRPILQTFGASDAGFLHHSDGTNITPPIIGGAARSPVAGAIHLGVGYPPGPFHGLIGELAIFSPPLSSGDLATVEGYMAWKWGTQTLLPSDHPYKLAAP